MSNNNHDTDTTDINDPFDDFAWEFWGFLEEHSTSIRLMN
jgi:hypothetical protein